MNRRPSDREATFFSRDRLSYVSFSLLAGVVLVLDALTPLGIAAPIGYLVIFLLFAQTTRGSGFPFVAASFCSGLLIAGLFLSPLAGIPMWISLVNRSLAIVAVWITAFVLVDKRTELLERLESEERQRRLVEVMPDAVLVNTKGRISYCNSASLRLFGASSPRDLLDRSPFSLFHPDYHQILSERIKTMLEGNGSLAVLEEKIVRLDGSVVPVEVVATAISFGGEKSIFVVIHDLTGRKAMEENLHLLVEGVKDCAIFMLDLDGNIVTWNTGAERIYGFKGEEVIGQSYLRFFPSEDRSNGEFKVELKEAGKHGFYDATGWSLRKDGSRFWANGMLTALYDDAGKLRGFAKITRDLTEKHQLELQLQVSQKMEAIGQLAGGVAHDFNNLLTVINGFCEVLVSEFPEGSPNHESLVQILRAGEKATALNRQLLAFGRRQMLEPKVLDLNAVVRDIEQMLQRLIGEDVQLRAVLSPSLSSVRVDPGQIEQVVMNLALNSRDAMEQGGKLTIETVNVELDQGYALTHFEARPGPYVLLAISDTGCGMTPEVRSRIFEPFFTTKRVGKGTGLGLSVVHGIIKQSGGNVEVYSEVGIGTTFKIYLPAVQEHPVPVLSTKASNAIPGTETILVVEDESAVRELITIALRRAGYTVLNASGGRDALEQLEKHGQDIDLIVTDVVMPEMGGSQLSQEAISRFPNLKVLYVSGYMDDAIVRHGILQAEVAFLQKPFTLASLTRKVREVLDQ